MGAFRVISRGIAFTRVVILARILTPAQFGVFGIASIFLALLEILTESGINIFLVQEKKDIDSYINDAWLVSIIRGVLITLLLILASPFIVAFFKMEEAYILMLLISTVPLIRGFINPSIVKFQKELQFNKEFLLRIAIFLSDSLVAVAFSLITRSAIGLVLGLMAGAILEVFLSFLFIKPAPRFQFSKNKIVEIINRGKWVNLYGIFNYVASQGDSVVIGKILGPNLLGIYQLGYKISTLPISEVSDVVNRVTFPVYAKISEDLARLRKGFAKTILPTSIISIMLGLLVFFFPKDLFILIFGEKWEATTTVLKFLASYGVIRAISGATSSLFLAVGKQNYVAAMTFLRLTTLAITIIPLTANFGIVGTAVSVLLSSFPEFLLSLFFVLLIFKLREKNQ